MSQTIINDVPPYTQAFAILNQTVFGTNWTANYPSDVVVYVTPVGSQPNDATQILAYPSQYSVSFVGSLQQVQVTLVTPSAAGDIVTVVRQTPADRENLYSNTNFTPSMLNNDFGILTLVDQQNALVDQFVAPRYNYSATINNNTVGGTVDSILPILPPNHFWVKNANNTAIIPALLPSGGFAPADATYITLTDDTAELPNSLPLSTLASGIMVSNASTNTIVTRSMTGTVEQILINNADGTAGNINIGFVLNPIFPGTAGIGIPNGTTGQRVIPASNISLRYNTSLEFLEYWDPVAMDWFQLHDSSTAFLPLAGGTMTGDIAFTDVGLVTPAYIKGPSGQPMLLFEYAANAVNGFLMGNSSTGNTVILDARGSDSSINMNLRTKNGDLWLSDLTGTRAPSLAFFDDIGTEAIGFRAPATLSASTYFVWMPEDGNAGDAITTDGNGNLSFNPVSGVTIEEVQAGDMNFALDTGVADAIVVTLDPTIVSLTNDLIIRVQVAHNNLTPSPTINPNGLGATGIALLGNNTVAVNDMVQNGIAVLIYNENLSNFILQNPATSLAATANVTNGLYTTVADTGTANNYVASSSFYPSLGPQNGQEVTFNPTHSNTGACNFNYNGQGNVGIHLIDGTDPLPDDIFLNTNAKLFYNAPTATWILTNPVVSGGSGLYLPLTGGTMSGDINMGANNISNIGFLRGSNNKDVAQFNDSSGSVNYFAFNASATGQPMTLDVSGTDANVTMNLRTKAADIWLSDFTGTRAVSLLWFDALGTNAVGFKAPNTLSADFVWTWPAIDGSTGDVMTTDGAGNLSFQPGGGAGGVTSTQVQQSAFNYGSDVTNTNGYVIALTPPITALTDGLTVFAAITNTNTGNVTLDVGTGPNAVESLQQILLNGGEIPGSGISSIFTWNASAGLWVLQNNAALSATSIQYQKYTYSVDSGAVNAYVGTYNPSLASLGAQDGLKVGLYTAFSATNTGPSTFDAGFGPQTVAMNDGVFSPTPPGAIANSGYYEFEWAASLGFWLLLNPSIQSTSTIFGTQTNDDAFVGYLGEFIESVIASGSAVSIPSSNTPVDIASIPLGAGDWDLYGNFGSNISGGTTTKLTAWISATSATQPDASQSSSVALSAIITGEGFCVPYQRISLSSPGTVYLSASATFTLSTVSGYGKISARRPR